MKKVDDKTLIETYKRLGSVWLTAKAVGLCGQSVHERLTKLNVIQKMNVFTKDDELYLLEHYNEYASTNRLQELADEMGRTKQFICRKAKSLGLTNKTNRFITDEHKNIVSRSIKKHIAECGHPKGMKGKHHSKEFSERMSERVKSEWKDGNSKFNSMEFRQSRSDNMHKMRIEGAIKSVSPFNKNIQVKYNGKDYCFKSSWEYEVASRLQTLKEDSNIKAWDYECKHFVFNDVSFGMRSYCPDFEVTRNDGSIFYIEVKGWKRNDAMKRISMFKERYKDVELIIIDKDEYRKLSEDGYLRRYTK